MCIRDRGKAFDQQGKLIYEGSFYQDQYSGAGKLYDPLNDILLYEGNFRNGLYDGQGRLYADNGIDVYKRQVLHSAGGDIVLPPNGVLWLSQVKCSVSIEE